MYPKSLIPGSGGLSRKLPKADIDLLSGIISAREKDRHHLGVGGLRSVRVFEGLRLASGS